MRLFWAVIADLYKAIPVQKGGNEGNVLAPVLEQWDSNHTYILYIYIIYIYIITLPHSKNTHIRVVHEQTKTQKNDLTTNYNFFNWSDSLEKHKREKAVFKCV